MSRFLRSCHHMNGLFVHVVTRTTATIGSPARSDLVVANRTVTGTTPELTGDVERARPMLEAAVVGMPDAIRDEVPAGFVADEPADPPTLAALHAWCADRLTKSKRPGDITLVDEPAIERSPV